MTNTSSIFERLKEVRKGLGLNQAQLAEICGVKRETWSRYESGLMSPSMDVLAAMAGAGADVQYILTGLRSATQEMTLNPREAALLDNYRNVDDETDKKLIERTAFLAAKADEYEAAEGTQKVVNGR